MYYVMTLLSEIDQIYLKKARMLPQTCVASQRMMSMVTIQMMTTGILPV